MTTPNYPYGDPQGDNSGGGVPNYGTTGSDGYQDPYGTSYSGGGPGGFENSPLNATRNRAAAWALGLGIASVVCALAIFTVQGAVLTLLAPFIAVAGVIVAIVALVKAKSITGPGKRRGMAVGGLVLSIITLLLTVFMIIVVSAIIGTGVLDCFTAEYPTTADQQRCVEDTLSNL